VKTTVRLVHKQDMRCEAAVGNARLTLRIDSLKHQALANSGPSPLDLLALAHGACTGMLVAMKGTTNGINVDGMDIEVVHDYDAGPPMRLKSARIRFMLAGDTTPEQEDGLRDAARLCPVHTALRPDVPVTFEVLRRA
jgi:uncharacterized OsmC-like protein